MATLFTRTASVEMYTTFEELALTRQRSFNELAILLRQAARPADDDCQASRQTPALTVTLPAHCTTLLTVASDESDQRTAEDEDTCNGIFKRTRSTSQEHAERLDSDGGQGEHSDASLCRPSRRSSPQACSRFEPYTSPKARTALARSVVDLADPPAVPSAWDKTLVEQRMRQEAPRARRGREGTRTKPQSEF